MRLHTKIVLLVVLIVIISGSLSIAYVGRLMHDALEDETKEDAMAVSQTISELIVQDVIDGDSIQATEALKKVVDRSKDVTYAYVVDFNNRIIAHSFEKGFPRAFLKMQDEAHLLGEEPALEKFILQNAAILDVRYPLIKGMPAHLHVGMNKTRLRGLFYNLIQRILLISVIAALLGVMLSLILSRRIARPLKQLTDYVQSYGEGKTEEVPEIQHAEREVSELAKAFSQMIMYRIEAEYELQESQQRLRKKYSELDHIYNTSPLGLCMMDSELRFVRINEAMAAINGRPVSEHIGRTIHEVIPEIAHQVEPIYRQVIENGEPAMNFEVHGVTPAAPEVERDWLVSYYPLKGSDGDVLGVGTIVQEITERKRVEEAVKENEKRFRTLVENIPGTVFRSELKPPWRVEYISESVSFLTGHAARDFLSNKLAFGELILDEDQKRVKQIVDEGVANQKPYEIEYRLRHASGEIRSVYEQGRAIYNADGKPLWLDGVIIDTTESKETAKALHAERDKAQRYLDIAGVMFVVVGANQQVELINRKGCEILGCNEEEVIGKNWFTHFIPQKNREKVRNVFDRLIDGEIEPIEYYENPVMTQNGEERIIAWHNSVFTDEAGKIISTLSSGEDITERKKLEAQLFQSQKMEAIGTLAGGIAHDFNNILSPIFGYTEMALLNLPEGNDEVQTFLEEVASAAYRAKDLVRQILTFSRSGEQDKKPLLMQTIIKETLKLLRASIPTTIEIRTHIDMNCGPVLAEPTQVHQVIMNLCTNAYQAMSDKGGGVLEVALVSKEVDVNDAALREVLPTGKYVMLTVTDTGHGIDQELIERIFDPYVTTKGEGEGTGLGLSVVHGIVKSCDGHVSVSSKPGQGTTFHVYLPQLKCGMEMPAAVSVPVIPKGTERILVVDDEEQIVAVARKMLEGLGYHVTAMTDSMAALEGFKEQPETFDLVLTDQTMPHLTGVMFAEELLTIRPDIPIILCTGYSQEISEEEAKALGFRRFLMKPLDMSDLALRVREVLDEQKQQK